MGSAQFKTEDEHSSKSFKDWQSEGDQFFRAQQYKKAIKAYEMGMLMNPDGNPELCLRAATAALKLQQFSKAEQLAEKALAIEEVAQAYTIKAIAGLETERPADSLKMLERAQEISPESATVKGLMKRTKEILQGLEAKETPPEPKEEEPSEQELRKLRRWKRAAIPAQIYFRDHKTGEQRSLPVLSLSAGGCLVEGQNLPPEFLFHLKIEGQELEIPGIAKLIYKKEGTKSGLLFKHVSDDTQSWVDEQVKEYLNNNAEAET